METTENISRCPVCASAIDYCPGHGEIGDRLGFNILAMHDKGDHDMCNPIGCDEKWDEEQFAEYGIAYLEFKAEKEGRK